MRFTSLSILLSVALLAGMATAAPLPADTHIDIDIHARRLHRHRKQNQNAVVPTQSATVQPQNCGTPPAPAAPPAPAPEAAPAPAPAPAPEVAAADFRLKNALAAQQLNAAFATLTTDAPCSAGQDACIGGAFAQCVNGSFVTIPCAAGVQCFALPLVNKPGTSITCDTPADALARIQAAGAQGGIRG